MESYFNADGKVLCTEVDRYDSEVEEQGQEAGPRRERRPNQFGYCSRSRLYVYCS